MTQQDFPQKNNDLSQKTSNPPCVRCGKEGFVEKADGEWLCEECYPILGSCCAEFAGDDMNPKD